MSMVKCTYINIGHVNVGGRTTLVQHRAHIQGLNSSSVGKSSNDNWA